MSDSLDRDLRWDERLALRGHLIACRVCPILKKQIEAISRVAREMAAHDISTPATESQKHEGVDNRGVDAATKQRWKNAVRGYTRSE